MNQPHTSWLNAVITRIRTHGYEAAALCLVACYGIGMSWLCLMKFSQFGYDDFDLAVHAQSVSNILRGSLDCSILGIPFLGNHMVPILFLAAPLCALFPTPQSLLVLQSVILGLGGWAVFLLARRELDHRFALLFSALYLVYPPLIFMNLYEFHPIALATTALLFGCNAFRGGRLALFLSCMILAMLCQENVALIVLCFGLLALLERRKPAWVIAPMLMGASYFILVVGILMPRLNQAIQFASIYGTFGDTLPDIASNILRHPLTALTTMLQPAKLNFLNLLSAPLAYLSLLSPASLVPLLLTLPQRLLSERPSESSILFHYQAEFIPFIFMAAISGTRRLLAWSQRVRLLRAVLRVALCVMPLLALTTSGVVPQLVVDARSTPWTSPLVSERIQATIDAIQPNDSLVATFEFLPILSSQTRLCSLHHLYTGCYTLSTVSFPQPDIIDWVLINTHDRLIFQQSGFYDPQGSKRLLTGLNNTKWDVAENLESFVALRRTTSTGTFPDDLIRFIDHADPTITNFNYDASGITDVTFLGLEMDPPDSNGATPLRLYWQTGANQPARDFDIVFRVRHQHLTHETRLAPGSRLFPPNDWPAATIIETRHHLALPAGFTPSIMDIEIRAMPTLIR